MPGTGRAAARYEQLTPDRTPYLQRARACAKLTIPSLVPEAGANASTTFTTPYQAVGARGVNNLAAKLLLTLFSQNYFKMEVDSATIAEMTGAEGMQAQVEKALTAYTKKALSNIERRAARATLFETLKQTLVAGNNLLYVPHGTGIRSYRLDRYVVKRDPAGTLLELVIKECIAYMAIPEAIRSQLPVTQEAKLPSQGKDKPSPPTEGSEDERDLFTHVYLDRDLQQYVVYQEIEGMEVPGSMGKYPLDKCPWIAIRCVKVDGEDYGRSYVEEYLGDLSSLEQLSQAVVQFTAVASRINPLIKPGSMVSAQRYAKAKTGDVLEGLKDDIWYPQVDKYQDFQVVHSFMGDIEKRLAFAFLLNTAIQRQGERVTTEEIRYMAQELEASLGGIYSLMSQELQLPFTRVVIDDMERHGELPPLPPQVTPVIVAGMDALGRANDLNNLDTMIAGTLQVYPQAGAYVNWSDYLQRRGNALGMDISGLIKTQQQVDQEMQQAQMAQLAQKLGPNAVNQLGGIAQKHMDQIQNGSSQNAPQQAGS